MKATKLQWIKLIKFINQNVLLMDTNKENLHFIMVEYLTLIYLDYINKTIITKSRANTIHFKILYYINHGCNN